MNRRTLSLIVLVVSLIYLGLAAISIYQYFNVAKVFADYGIPELEQVDMGRIVELRRTFLGGFIMFFIVGLPSLLVGIGLYLSREWARKAWLILALVLTVFSLSRFVLAYPFRAFWLIESVLEVILFGGLAIISWKTLYGRQTVSGPPAS